MPLKILICGREGRTHICLEEPAQMKAIIGREYAPAKKQVIKKGMEYKR